jgi:endonuclease/exonuclease/phosphatase family metal-dependent hydrolase
MRVATFNILHGQRVRTDAGYDPSMPAVVPDDLAVAAAELDVDVLGMQEVDAHQPRSGGVDQTLLAAEALAGDRDAYVHRLFVPSVVGTPGHRSHFAPADEALQRDVHDGPTPEHGPLYGVALISRAEVLSWHRVSFGAPRLALPLLVPAGPRPKLLTVPDEPRSAIAAVIRSESGATVTVATAHLSFVPGVNVVQLRRLVAWLRQFPRPLILMGDFNLPGALPGLVTRWPGVVTAPTYPSFAPKIQFDHIMLDGFDDEVVAQARRSVEILPMAVSDHCAVVADVEV